jgi:tRNA threonylcarbamoyl adenosine modification protein (Sua5/YciO/YrdC/YwlC family)
VKKISIDPNNINHSLVKEAADTIFKGGIVALPTETVYGLAVSSEKKDAVEKLYKIKNRPSDKPFTFIVKDSEEVKGKYFSALPPFGYRMMERFWPGPLTIVYYSKQNEVVGVRVPAHNVTHEILKEIDAGVYLPSANISGDQEAVSADSVEDAFKNQIDLIVDGGSCLYSKPSTVINLTYHPFKILRSGVVSERKIIETFTRKRLAFVCTGNTCRSPMAQFLLEKAIMETAPYLRTRYEIISRGIAAFEGSSVSSEVLDILRDKENVYVDEFAAKKLDKETILSSDLIFTMEESQRKYILNLEPTADGRIFNLGQFLSSVKEQDIPDPIGKGKEVYVTTYSLIKEAIVELQDWL